MNNVAFDPYSAWLNIPDGDRPPGPYQLLGLAPLEPDVARIRAGYQRQLTLLLNQLDKTDPQFWEQIKNELDDAFALLSDAEQKAVLDAAIRRRGPVARAEAPGSQAAAPPATAAATGTVTCRGCQRANPGSRKFCGGCGQSLWEACPQCGTECPADERFCGACGTDILSGLGQNSRRLQEKLDEARQQLEAYQFEAALSTLRSVASVSDPRMEKWAQAALVEIGRMDELRQRQQQGAVGSLASAQQFMVEFAYEKAITALEEIPAPLRSPEASKLLERATAARKELLTLYGEIREGMDHMRVGDLLPKVERLLALKPNHKQSLVLGEQMRDMLVKSAKNKLARHEYQPALDDLALIPSFVRSDEVIALTDTASELHALLDTVRGAALADKPTLALAQRLAKLAATNEAAAKLRAQIAERAATKPADPRLGAPNWSPVPKRTTVGAPVDWLAHFNHLPASDAAATVMREHPGQMFVALGLALQGLGLAAIPVDFTPRDKGGMLGMLPAFSLGRKGPAAAWGLDLSDYALKAVKLVKDPKTDAIQIAACEFILHERSLGLPEAEMLRGEIVSATLEDFLSRSGELKGCKVGVGIPAHKVLGRFFEIPPLPAKKAEDAIAYEARHQMPIDLDELCWESHILDALDGKAADQEPRRVLVVAAREIQVKDRLATFKAAGINVDLVQSDCLALHNAAVQEFFPSGDAEASDNSAAIGLVDVGTDSTSVLVSSPRSVWFRTFSQGGGSFTSALVNDFKLTYSQAEQLKRDPSRARRLRQYHEALDPLLTQVSSEIVRSFVNYAKLAPERPIARAYGVGGAFQTYGLLRRLRFGK